MCEEKQLEEKCGVTSNPLMKEEQRTEAKDNHDKEEEEKNEETDWMMTLDDDLFEKS